jgi:hypothetical protein
VKRFCADCNPCPHGKLKHHCTSCNPCPHGKLKHACAACSPSRQAETRLRVMQSLPPREDEKQVRVMQPLLLREVETQLQGMHPMPAREAERQLCSVQPLPSRQAEKEVRGLQVSTRGSGEFARDSARDQAPARDQARTLHHPRPLRVRRVKGITLRKEKTSPGACTEQRQRVKEGNTENIFFSIKPQKTRTSRGHEPHPQFPPLELPSVQFSSALRGGVLR